jgi:multidrug resistance efflux pump
MSHAASTRAALAGLVALAGAAGCGGAGHTPAAATAAPSFIVARGTLEDRIVLTGEVEALISENFVVPPTPNWLLPIRWIADDGILLKKGDRVVEFDTSSFTTNLEDKRGAIVRTAAELATQVAKDRATVADKEMEVDRKRTALEKATIEAGVAPDLYPKRLYQEKQLALLTAKDELAKAEDDLAAQTRAARLEQTIKAVARTKADRDLTDVEHVLEALTLRAPRDGLLQVAINRRENRKFLVGDNGQPGWVVATMPDLGALQVRARLSDVDDGGVRAGMRADCVLDAYPSRIWKGAVDQVSPVARADGKDTVRRFFDVVIALEGAASDVMRPGMSMRIEVLRHRAEEALLVPRALVSTWPGKARVRLASGRDETVEVEWCNDMACVVRGGLLEGTTLSAAAGGGKGPS